MAEWRFPLAVITGPQSGTVIAELPLLDVSIVDVLNAPGALTGSMPLEHPDAALFLQPPNSPSSANVIHQAALYALRDGVMMGGPFYFAGGDIDIAQGSFPVRFDGWWQLVRQRHIRNASNMTYGTLKAGEVRFDQVDQFHIVEDLIDHIQGITGGNLNLQVAWSSLSGVLRDRSYEADKGKSAGEAIEQLAAVQDGFDWAVVPSGTPENPTITLQLFHPRRGRNTDFAFVFAHDGHGSANVIGATITTGPAPVTRFVAVGPGEGPSQLVRRSADPSLFDVVPLNESANSWVDVTEGPTLKAHADRNLSARGARGDLPRLTVDPNAVPKLGSYSVGDNVTVDLRTATLSHVSTPVVQLNGTYRIIGRTIRVTENGAETVDLDLANPGRY